MKLLRTVVILAIAVVIIVVVWRSSPGCRQQAMDAYRKYGGWTEEARKADPVGFIEYAEKKLNEDLASFAEANRSLAGARQTIEDERTRTQDLLEEARQLGAEFRTAYQEAEAASSYPVTVRGRSYSRDDLIAQVRLILVQKDNYEDIAAALDSAAQDVDERAPQLVVQINSTKAALSTLPSRKEIARINKLTGSTEELLAQVNEVIGENEHLLAESPVRTVEELVQAREEPAEAADASVDVLAFLEAAE